MFTPKTILVATDFSEFSDRALKDALEMAENYKAKLILLHVIDEHLQQCVVDYCLSAEAFTELQEKTERNSWEKLQEELKKTAPQKNGNNVAFKVRVGVPYSEILNEQQEDGADLIVLGSHGKRGFVHNMLGGVADKVTRGAGVSVLVVR
jgi:universal stress protein A